MFNPQSNGASNDLVLLFEANEDDSVGAHSGAFSFDTAAYSELTPDKTSNAVPTVDLPQNLRVDLNSVAIDDTVGLYLREMSSVPLLTLEEEIDLSQRYERGRAAKAAQAEKAPITQAEYEQLAFDVQDGLDAREHLIRANTRLVVSIAKRYLNRGVPFLDLIQEGNLGLMKAVEKFDYTRGFRFSTYATWWIRQTISRAIADQGRTIRLPVHMSDKVRQMFKLTQEFEQSNGREPSVAELAILMEEDPEKIAWMQRVSWRPVSLEQPVGDEEENEFGAFIEDELTPSPTQTTYDKLLAQTINDVLDTLTPREARVLRLRFGLHNGKTHTLEEVGTKFGLTRERIRQIEGKALRRLRHPRRSRQLQAYVS